MREIALLKVNIFIPFLTAFVLVLFITPLVILLAKKWKLVDDPKKRRHPAIIHKKPIPRGGGIALFASIFITTLLFLPPNTIVLTILAGGALAVLIGTLDDKFELSPYFRFLTNLGAASLPVFLGGIGINFITNPFGGILSFNFFLLPQILAILWIVWTMNMLNWSKGVDGQMPGIAAIAAITIGILGLRFYPPSLENIITIKLSFLTAGAALGFLVYNFYPAKIFPGYGATILGFLLAITSILAGSKLATAILVMGVPTIDGIFTIIRRIASGRSPFLGDRGHFHHLLLQVGWGQRRIALFYWGFSAVLGTIALNLSSKEKFFAIFALLILGGGAILWLSKFKTQSE